MSDIITRQYGITKSGVRYTVELRIDVSAVAAEMVNNAVRNTTGKASQMGGSLFAKVIDRAAPSSVESPKPDAVEAAMTDAIGDQAKA